MTDTATLGIDLLESFEQLVAHLGQFADHLQADQDLPLWISLTDQELASYTTMRQKAVLLFRTLWYEDGQDGRETLTCPGIVGASPATVEAALRLNDSKDRFKAAVLALKQLNKTQTTALLADLHKRNEESRPRDAPHGQRQAELETGLSARTAAAAAADQDRFYLVENRAAPSSAPR